MSPERRLRVGLVGGGKIAQVAQLPTLASRSDVLMAGIVTHTSESTERNLQTWPIESGYPTLTAMIDSADLDAVFVLTPRLSHAELVEEAIDAGLDVFCEKPLATSSRDALRLAELADAAGVMLSVGLNRRYAEVYAIARDQFAHHADFVVAQKNRNGSEYRATFENAIHMVDLMRWFCGEPTSVTAEASFSDPYLESGLMALIRFESGATASLIAARTAGIWDERFEAYGGGVGIRVIAPDRVEIDHGEETRVVEMRPRRRGWVEATVTLGFKGCVEAFLEAIRSRVPTLTSGREAAKTQKLLDDILSAAGLPIVEDPDREWTSHA